MGLFIDLCRFIQYGDLPTSYYTKRGMKIGINFNRQSDTKFDPSHCWLIRFGDNVTVANRVLLLAHDDSIRTATGYGKIGGIVIGDNVFLGAGTIVLPGVTIGSNTVVAAGSVVSHNIPGGVIAAGVPAHVIGSYYELIRNAEKDLSDKKEIVFDISWSIYGTPPISIKRKEKMFDMLDSTEGYQQLWKYENKNQ